VNLEQRSEASSDDSTLEELNPNTSISGLLGNYWRHKHSTSQPRRSKERTTSVEGSFLQVDYAYGVRQTDQSMLTSLNMTEIRPMSRNNHADRLRSLESQPEIKASSRDFTLPQPLPDAFKLDAAYIAQFRKATQFQVYTVLKEFRGTDSRHLSVKEGDQINGFS
jgi:hypothetical protein